MRRVTIVRQGEYNDVFGGRVSVPDMLLPGLVWIQEHCPLHEPHTVALADLAAVWNVPESIILPGLRTLLRTGFFTLEEVD
ncbi:MAG: hypothetical protein JW910_05870 [Anaerolineae bacterium]|nr:hypothetical protein [Anaerolineae bacterium]